MKLMKLMMLFVGMSFVASASVWAAEELNLNDTSAEQRECSLMTAKNVETNVASQNKVVHSGRGQSAKRRR